MKSINITSGGCKKKEWEVRNGEELQCIIEDKTMSLSTFANVYPLCYDVWCYKETV